MSAIAVEFEALGEVLDWLAERAGASQASKAMLSGLISGITGDFEKKSPGIVFAETLIVTSAATAILAAVGPEVVAASSLTAGAALVEAIFGADAMMAASLVVERYLAALGISEFLASGSGASILATGRGLLGSFEVNQGVSSIYGENLASTVEKAIDWMADQYKASSNALESTGVDGTTITFGDMQVTFSNYPATASESGGPGAAETTLDHGLNASIVGTDDTLDGADSSDGSVSYEDQTVVDGKDVTVSADIQEDGRASLVVAGSSIVPALLIPIDSSVLVRAPGYLIAVSSAQQSDADSGDGDSIVAFGNSRAILASSNGDIINTGPGVDDVVLLPNAVDQADSGTTIVVSPGTKTIVGGGANDRLVLLTDRLGGDTNVAAAAGDLSATTPTIQLNGGWYAYDPDPDGYSEVFGLAGAPADNPHGNPYGYINIGENYIVQYGMVGSDLRVFINSGASEADDLGATLNGWASEITIKNYQPGDFGLRFETLTGTDGTDAGFSALVEKGEADFAAPAVTQTQTDDDPTAMWDGWISEGITYNTYQSPIFAGVGSAQLAFYQKALSALANDDSDGPQLFTSDTTFTADSQTVGFENGVTLTVAGDQDTAVALEGGKAVLAGANDLVDIDFGTADIKSGVTGEVDGDNDTVSIEGIGTVKGDANSVVVTGSATVNGNESRITLGQQAQVTVNGSSPVFVADDGNASDPESDGNDVFDGTLTVASGSVSLLGGMTGSGSIVIGSSATAEVVDGVIGSSNEFDFKGGSGTLQIDTGATVLARIVGLGDGSKISVSGGTVTTASYDPASGQLAITTSDGATTDLRIEGSYAQTNFGVANGEVYFSNAPILAIALVDDTGASASDGITSDSLLTGTGDPDAVMHFSVDGAAVSPTATANANGVWSYQPTGLKDGQHTVQVSETNAAGYTGTASQAFTLDTTPPKVSIDDSGEVASPSFEVTGSAGTADANTTVDVLEGTTQVGTALVRSDGSWDASVSFTQGDTYVLTAEDTDVAGNVGVSDPATFTYDPYYPYDYTSKTLPDGSTQVTLSSDGVIAGVITTGIIGEPYNETLELFAIDGKETEFVYEGFTDKPYVSEDQTFGADGNIVGTFYYDQNGNVVACYCRGTLIRTDRGEIAVETLCIADTVINGAGVCRPIKWIGRRSYAGRFANANRDVLPICFKAGSLAENVPVRDLWVSPKHAMFIDGVLIPADHLVNGVSIVQADSVDFVEYFHIELDSHDVIVAEGALSESFVDDGCRAMFHNAHEFAALYPDVGPVEAVYCAPRVEDGAALEAVSRRLAERAGLPVSRSVAYGRLRGFLERVDNCCLAGWAQSEGFPDAPVCLEVLVNGCVAATVLAERFRPDLARAGIGDGCHAFEARLQTPVASQDIERVTVRRAADGAELTRLAHMAAARPVAA